ncbi:MAG: hypothetical protein M3O15_08475 [Acidobacteriota bacterium]|nr:hypothetical protein [Acidobacteriota bacterium]
MPRTNRLIVVASVLATLTVGTAQALPPDYRPAPGVSGPAELVTRLWDWMTAGLARGDRHAGPAAPWARLEAASHPDRRGHRPGLRHAFADAGSHLDPNGGIS